MHRNLLSFSAPLRLSGNIICNQKGVSIVAVIAAMLILSVMGVTLISLVTTGSDVSINQLRSEQAFNVAEGGKEYVLANRIFPNYSLTSATNLGPGNFTVATPTYLTGAVAVGNTAINVNSTSGFASPPSKLVIDSEVMIYTAMTANTFTIAAATSTHSNGNAVYPVTTITADPGVAGTTLNVASTTGFIVPGTVKIDNEYLYCTGATAVSFTGCMRGYNASTPAAHGIGSNVFQYVINSTAAVGSAQRAIRASVGGGIGFDAASSATGNTNSLSWSHTVGVGSNRILIVGVSIMNSATQTVTGVTYAGTALTPVGFQNNGTNCRVEIWRLVAPATGPNNIVVTLSASARFVAGAVSFSNVDQTNPIDAATFAPPGNSNAPSVIVTTVTDNSWVIDTLAAIQNITVTVGAGQSEHWNINIGGGPNRINGAGSTEGPKTPAGAVTMSWSLSAAQPWSIGAVALKPATGGVSVLDWQERY